MSCPYASRRGFLAGAGLAAAATAGGIETVQAARAAPATEPFYGPQQGGIATAKQRHTYFAAFDITAEKKSELIDLLRAWTAAAAVMTAGAPVPAGDSNEALGLAPSRLTLTFGFGPGLFASAGHDRFGLMKSRPAALVDLPRFNGDQLIEAKCGGDLSVQACAEDPQVAFHAVRQLARLAYGAATIRWAQSGFSGNFAPGETGRNLMGFRDGTQNPPTTPRQPTTDAVWVGAEGPAWMRQGSYLVVRRIRIALEHWDRTDVDYQEQVVGRQKNSGAPLGGAREFDPLNLAATRPDGNPVIPEDAHVRLAAAATNGGAQMLRRAYSYNDGVSFTAERWPPWRQGMEYDAGLLFIAYQRDPRTGFMPVFERLSKLDAMNQFTTHVGSGVFACPGGVARGGFIGEGLFS